MFIKFKVTFNSTNKALIYRRKKTSILIIKILDNKRVFSDDIIGKQS